MKDEAIDVLNGKDKAKTDQSVAKNIFRERLSYQSYRQLNKLTKLARYIVANRRLIEREVSANRTPEDLALVTPTRVLTKAQEKKKVKLVEEAAKLSLQGNFFAAETQRSTAVVLVGIRATVEYLTKELNLGPISVAHFTGDTQEQLNGLIKMLLGNCTTLKQWLRVLAVVDRMKFEQACRYVRDGCVRYARQSWVSEGHRELHRGVDSKKRNCRTAEEAEAGTEVIMEEESEEIKQLSRRRRNAAAALPAPELALQSLMGSHGLTDIIPQGNGLTAVMELCGTSDK